MLAPALVASDPFVGNFIEEGSCAVRIAVLVGTVPFTINQLDIVVRGAATPVLWLKVALTYLVPFCVSNLGILIASRREPGTPR